MGNVLAVAAAVQLGVEVVKWFVQRPTQPRDVSKEIRDAARKELNLNCVDHINFGVIGGTGSGKSSFINAVRGVRADNGKAAEVGITETTDCIRPYPHPVHGHIILWDIPGCGTIRFPIKDYFQKQKLVAFDFLLIITHERFLQCDADLASEARKNGLPFAFVRTKSDRSIEDQMNDYNKTDQEAAQILRDAVKGNLTEHGLGDAKHFIISNRVMFNLFSENEGTQRYLPMDENKLVQHVLSEAFRCRNQK